MNARDLEGKQRMIVPKATPEEFASFLRTWAGCIIREDGDRDEDAASRLTCEQTLAVARVMLGAAHKIDDLLLLAQSQSPAAIK